MPLLSHGERQLTVHWYWLYRRAPGQPAIGARRDVLRSVTVHLCHGLSEADYTMGLHWADLRRIAPHELSGAELFEYNAAFPLHVDQKAQVCIASRLA